MSELTRRRVMDTYTDEHWIELIKTIITRIGVKRFLNLTIMVLNELGYTINVNDNVVEE